jgi:hypothetical protein
MKKIKIIALFVCLIYAKNMKGQQLYNITRKDSTNQIFPFEQTLLNAEGNFVDLSMNYVSSLRYPLLATEMDRKGVILKSTKFKFYSDSLATFCPLGSVMGGTEFALTNSIYYPIDSSYYFSGVLVSSYGNCNTIGTSTLLKMDKNLNTLWFREYYAASYCGLNISIDISLIVSARSNIRKLNPSNGDTLWSRTFLPINGNSYGLLGQNRAYCDSEFVVCGGTNLFNHPARRGIVTKFNQGGDVLWSKAYGDNTPEYFHAINPTNDSSYIIVNEHDYSNFADASLVKISGDGTFLWGKYYDWPGKRVQAYDVVNTPDNNYLLTLTAIDTLTFNVLEGYLLKLDTVGNILWSKRFDPPLQVFPNQEILTKFIPNPDGGYFLNGRRLVQIDSTGYGCWFVNDSNAVVAHDLFFATDTTPLVYQAPTYNDNMHINTIIPAFFSDSMWVDSCYNTTSIATLNLQSGSLVVYPNPVVNQLAISNSQLAMGQTVTVAIYDVLGKQKQQQHFATYDGKFSLDVNGLSSGIYFLKVEQGGKVYNANFVKE